MSALFVNPHAITLREYQVEDRQATAEAFLNEQKTRLATASGKTVMFSELHLEPSMKAWLSSFSVSNQKILVIAHRKELIEQAAKKLSAANPDLYVDVEKGAQKVSLLADVFVASIQTLTASKGKRLKRLNADNFRIVILDEAHHAASPSYHVVLQHFGFLPPAGYMADTRPSKWEGRAAILEWQRTRLAAWDGSPRPDKLLLGVTSGYSQARLTA